MQSASPTLAERVRSISPPADGVRWLVSEDDAEALRALIRACYGDSYSYAALYDRGGLEDAWRRGALISLGEFTNEGDLRGHTGFWAKDPLGEALESGLSLVDPRRRRESRTQEKRVWPMLRAGLAPLVHFVHQHTTTLHAMAQRYALRHMQARPTGLIPFYARGESVRGLNETGADMHALCMTTHLRPRDSLALAHLPRGPWRPWLAACADAAGVGIANGDEPISAAVGVPSGPELLERNTALDLRRRRLSATDVPAPIRLPVEHRVELVHVPATAGISALAPALHAAGFVPCGLHLHRAQRPHDIVFVHVADPRRVAASVRAAKLATPELQQLWTTWCDTCEHTS